MEKENRSTYVKHEIKPSWNHGLAPKVRELGLSPVTENTLQAICKFENGVYLYEKTNAGLPFALNPHLGYTPTKAQVLASITELLDLKYITQRAKGNNHNRSVLYFDVNKTAIEAGPFGDDEFYLVNIKITK